MTGTTALLAWRVRVFLARAHQHLGWAGIAGVALLVAATGALHDAWPSRSPSPDLDDPAPSGPIQKPAPQRQPPVAGPPMAELPAQAEAALLLARVHQAAVDNGLAWPSAAYRFVPGTAGKPPSLEIRTTLNGPYLSIRRMLSDLLAGVPPLALREASFSRPGADSAIVEAKVVIAIFVRDPPEPAPLRTTESRP